jgi:hypothetical protein
MTTINTSAQPQGILSTGAPAVARADKGAQDTPSNGVQATANDPITPSAQVTISGHALLVSRLFHTDEAHYNGTPKTTPLADGGSNYDYLTSDDRKMVEDMYSYCAAKGMDLRYVDALALDLAEYRVNGPHVNDAVIYDTEGHRMTFDWKEQDKEIADHVLQGDEIDQTSIDHGFLQAEFKPGGRFANFAFLEKMMSVFSTGCGGDTQGTSDDSFKVYTSMQTWDRIQTTKSKDVELVIPESDSNCIDGVFHWRTPELAEANRQRALHDKGSTPSRELGKEILDMLTSYAKSKNIDTKQIDDLMSMLDQNRPQRAK